MEQNTKPSIANGPFWEMVLRLGCYAAWQHNRGVEERNRALRVAVPVLPEAQRVNPLHAIMDERDLGRSE